MNVIKQCLAVKVMIERLDKSIKRKFSGSTFQMGSMKSEIDDKSCLYVSNVVVGFVSILGSLQLFFDRNNSNVFEHSTDDSLAVGSVVYQKLGGSDNNLQQLNLFSQLSS